MPNFRIILRVFLAVYALMQAAPASAISVGMQPLKPAPTYIGDTVIWNAWIEDGAVGPIWYRFRIRYPGEANFRTVRDFSPQGSLKWIPTREEGTYEIEVTAASRDSGQRSTSIVRYEVMARAVDSPAISPTANTLVFLYSAPPCAPGSRMSVSHIDEEGLRQTTPAMDCRDGKSMNVYLAGFRAESNYTVQHTVRSADGSVTRGPSLTLKTGALGFTPAPTRPRQTGGAGKQAVLVQNRLFEYSVATDAAGNVIWYVSENFQYLTRFEAGGYFFALIEDEHAPDYGQLLRQLDLAGNTILETNAARVSDQLNAMGMNGITSFHHEARRLPNGDILVLAASERLLTGIQGPEEVDVIGDTILVLNSDLQVVWVWDSFDHLDVRRRALLDEKCFPATGGCPVFRLAPVANDWLHGNSLSLTADGNLIYSARHQDWIIKINYANGAGDGAVLWRLGKDGDFRIISSDPQPWFSHQHDANFEAGDPSRLLLFDNGNTRWVNDPGVHSRGQVFALNENDLTAELVLNADLGEYALALGSAQKLVNGNYFFDLGWAPNTFSHALEFDPGGKLVSQFEVETQQYRSFRMRDLYTP